MEDYQEYLDLAKSVIKEVEARGETEEYKIKSQKREAMCEKILTTMPLTTLEEIRFAKTASKSIPNSAEKVLLFRHLIILEKEVKRNYMINYYCHY